MPSTRKQKAKEKRSRQSDVMSDLENIDVMLGVYPGNHSDDEIGDMKCRYRLKVEWTYTGKGSNL